MMLLLKAIVLGDLVFIAVVIVLGMRWRSAKPPATPAAEPFLLDQDHRQMEGFMCHQEEALAPPETAPPDKMSPDAAIASLTDLVDGVRLRIASYGRLISLARGCLQDDKATPEERCAAALNVLRMESDL